MRRGKITDCEAVHWKNHPFWRIVRIDSRIYISKKMMHGSMRKGVHIIMRKKYTLPGLLIMVAVLLLMSACGGSSVTAGQLLTNSANAMKQVKSLHMDMTATVNLAVSGVPSSNSTTFP